MADSRGSGSRTTGGLVETWRRLNTEQRVAAIGAVLLVVSTLGQFSFVEAAIALTGLGVLALLKQRADRKEFHLPGGDGTVILLAGLWSALLIVIRILDRPLGQSVLALACAAIVVAAGLRERTKNPADDVAPAPVSADEDETVRIDPHDERTVRLPADEQPPGG